MEYRPISKLSLGLTSTAIILVIVGGVGGAWIVSKRLDRQLEQQRRRRDRRDASIPSRGTPTTTAEHVTGKQREGDCFYETLIGQTPLVILPNLSSILNRSIYVKLENYNPGGTGKDRAAWSMIHAAEAAGQLPPPYLNRQNDTASMNNEERPKPFCKVEGTIDEGIMEGGTTQTELWDELVHRAMERSRSGGLVVEGTSGSTGIALATICATRGHACLVVLPDDQALEKQKILLTLGAVIHIVANVSISNPNHYVNIAKRITERAQQRWNIKATFTDQFENLANFQVHWKMTGPELFHQCPYLDAFVMSAGTGGTIAGVAKFLKENDITRHCQIVLVDPPGSALYNKVEYGVAYTSQQRERDLLRHRYDTLAEGIGLDRITLNFSMGVQYIDKAIRVTDQEALDMAHWLLHNEGLWVGSSTAMNIVGAIRTALGLPTGSKVVTMVCDNGNRHLTRFWNRDFCLEWGLKWPGDDQASLPDCLHTVTIP